MKNNKKRRQRLARVYVVQLRDELDNLVAKTNAFTHTERQITLATAIEVANRSLRKTRDMNPESRVFAAVKAVQAHIALATENRYTTSSLENSDLLPVGHPLSTKQNAMTASALRHAQGRWIAADRYISEDVRPLIAAAYAEEPGSVARRHYFARVSAMPNSSVPQAMKIAAVEESRGTAITAALFSFGGNSEAARSMRAKLQRRDRYGRFAFMGGGFSFNLRGLDGSLSKLTGSVVGASGSDLVEIEVSGHPSLPDGIYAIKAGKGESVKAVLSPEDVADLPDVDVTVDSRYVVDQSSLERMDAPSGWKKQDTEPGAPEVWKSDDGYFVTKENDNLTLNRTDIKTSEIGDEVTSSTKWSDIQKAALADQDAFKKAVDDAQPQFFFGTPRKQESTDDGYDAIKDSMLEEGWSKSTGSPGYGQRKSFKKQWDDEITRRAVAEDARRGLTDEDSRVYKPRDPMKSVSSWDNEKNAILIDWARQQEGDFYKSVADQHTKRYGKLTQKQWDALEKGFLKDKNHTSFDGRPKDMSLEEAQELADFMENSKFWIGTDTVYTDGYVDGIIKDSSRASDFFKDINEGKYIPTWKWDSYREFKKNTEEQKFRSGYSTTDTSKYQADGYTPKIKDSPESKPEMVGEQVSISYSNKGWAAIDDMGPGLAGNDYYLSQAEYYLRVADAVNDHIDATDEQRIPADNLRAAINELKSVSEAAPEAPSAPEAPKAPVAEIPSDVVDLDMNGNVRQQIIDAAKNKQKVRFMYNKSERIVTPSSVSKSAKGVDNMKGIDQNGDQKTFTLDKIEAPEVAVPETNAPDTASPDFKVENNSDVAPALLDIYTLVGLGQSDGIDYSKSKLTKDIIDEYNLSDEEVARLEKFASAITGENGGIIKEGTKLSLPDGVTVTLEDDPKTDAGSWVVRNSRGIETSRIDAISSDGRDVAPYVEGAVNRSESQVTREDVRWDADNGVYTDVNGDPLTADQVDDAGLDSSLINAPEEDIKPLEQSGGARRTRVGSEEDASNFIAELVDSIDATVNEGASRDSVKHGDLLVLDSNGNIDLVRDRPLFTLDDGRTITFEAGEDGIDSYVLRDANGRELSRVDPSEDDLSGDLLFRGATTTRVGSEEDASNFIAELVDSIDATVNEGASRDSVKHGDLLVLDSNGNIDLVRDRPLFTLDDGRTITFEAGEDGIDSYVLRDANGRELSRVDPSEDDLSGDLLFRGATSPLAKSDIRWDEARGVYTDTEGNELDADQVDAAGLDSTLRNAPEAGVQPLEQAAQSNLDDILAEEFDSMFETPDGAYKPNIYEPYKPEGRTNQDSFDYTDDPAVLANTFSQAELTRALSEAVLPGDGDAASGYGNLPFEAGDEAVKAEAIYEALNQDADGAGDKVLAALYDSELPDDREMTNLERINMFMEDMDRDFGDEIPTKQPSARDDIVVKAVEKNRGLAVPTKAQRALDLMNNHEESNPKINELADDLMSRQDNGDGFDSINLEETFAKYYPWSKSNDQEEKEAFSALWGMFMSLDGGSSEEDLTPENLADGEAFRTILYNSLLDLRDGDEDAAMMDYEDLIDEYGGMPEFVAGKEAIASGDADLSNDSTAAAFYRLVKSSSRPNQTPLYRSIGVRNDDPLLQQYTTEGTVFGMDARSFTATNITDGSLSSQMFYPAGAGESRVIFSVAPGEIDSVDASTISWFSGENEHFGFGSFEVASVKKQKGLGRTDEYVVELKKVAPQEAADTADSDMSYTDVEGWTRVSRQLGSNPGGIFEDANGNQYYVKVPKSPSHAQNESLASALYKELGIDAVEVNIGFSDGEMRTVSPIVPNSKTDLGSRLDDDEYMQKLREGFAVDAWLANWDVAGLTYDNVITDGNGNPVRVDPGGALSWRAQGAPKGKLFGNSVGELDTLRDPDLNPTSSEVFGPMTDEEIEASARKLLDITPDRIDELVDEIVTNPEEAAVLKEKLKARREDILGRYGIEESNLFQEATPINTEGDVERPKLPDNPADPEAMKQYRQQLADYQAAKAVADAWNCDGGGGITAAGDNPCNIPTADDLIDSVVNDGPLDPDTIDSADKMIADLLDFMKETEEENLKASTKSKIKEIGKKLSEIQQGIKDGTISKAAGIQMLNDLAASITVSGSSEDAITLESIQDIVSEIRRVLDGTINDRVDTPDLPPVKSGKGYAKDGITFLRPGMRVRTKWGYAGTVDRYDKNSWQVWVTMDIDPSGKHAPGYKKMSFSTKTLDFIDPDGGDDTPWIDLPGVPDGKKPKSFDYTPVNVPPKGSKAEEYSKQIADKIAKMKKPGGGAKPPKAEAPEGAPEVPEVATPEVEIEEPSVPEASSIPDPVTKFDKGKVTGTGAKKVIVENPPSFEYSAFETVPSMRGALDSLTDENVKFAKVRGSSAAFDGGDIEDLEVRVEGIVDEDGKESTRISYKLTAWAGDDLVQSIESGDGEWEEKTNVAIPRTAVDEKTGAILIKKGNVGYYKEGAYSASGKTYTADLGNGASVTFRRTNADYSALHNYVTIDLPYGASDEDITRAMNIAGVKDPRPATKTDFRVLAENRLMSIFTGNTNAAKNIKVAATRETKLAEIEQRFGITPDDVSIKVGPSGQIETVIPDSVGQKIAEMTNADTLEHDFSLHAFVNIEAIKLGVDSSTFTADEKRAIIINGLIDFFTGPRGGGLVATRARYFTGMQISGMSSDSDLGTGGADYVFLRPSNGGNRHKGGVYGEYGAELAFDAAKTYTRLDWYANQTDKYGKRANKTDVISNARIGAYEVMFKKRLGLESLRSLALNEQFREKVLEEFKNRGISEYNGRPIEEVIVIAGRPNDPTGKIAEATKPLAEKISNLGAYGVDFGDISYSLNDIVNTKYPYPPYGSKLFGVNSDLTKVLSRDGNGQFWIYDGKLGKKEAVSASDVAKLAETIGTPDSEFSIFTQEASKNTSQALNNVKEKLVSGQFTPEEAAKSLMGIMRQGPPYSVLLDIRAFISANAGISAEFKKIMQGD